MANAKAKTVENKLSVTAFIKTVPDQQKQQDCFAIIDLMKEQSGFEPKMWGPAIVGFGKYHYIYESGREGDAPLAAFSPRKNAIVVYFEAEFTGKEALLKQLGKHTSSKACVYIKKLADINIAVLNKMITNSMKHTRSRYK